MRIVSLVVKGKFDKTSKSLKILWKWLWVKPWLKYRADSSGVTIYCICMFSTWKARTSLWQMFFFQMIFKIVVLKIDFAETAVLEPLSNKVVGLDTWNFIKNRFHHRCFPLKFVKFFRTSFLTEHLQQLLLKGKIISPNYLFFSQHSYSLMNFVEILFSNKFFIHKNYVQNIHCLAIVRHD